MQNLETLTAQINKQERLVNRLEKKYKKQLNKFNTNKDETGFEMLITQSETQMAYIILNSLKSCLNEIEKAEKFVIR